MTEELEREGMLEGSKAMGDIRENEGSPLYLALLLLAGSLAIIAPLVLFIGCDMEGHLGILGLFNFGPEFNYGWAISVLGVLLIAFSVLAHKRTMKMLALVDIAIGPVLIALPFIIAHHWLYKFDENDLTMAELFFGLSDGSWYVYLGGILAIIAGTLAIIFGFLMFKRMRVSRE